MYKKFACFSYNKDEIDKNSNLFLNKYIPKRIRNHYIFKNKTGKIEKIKCLGVDGYLITLPFTQEQLTDISDVLLDKMISKTLSEINEEEICIVTKPKTLIFPYDYQVRIAEQKSIQPLLIFSLIKEIIKFVDLDQKDLDIAIIDGNNNLTSLIIYNLYNELNYLTIFSDDISKFKELAEYIYKDVGLNILFLDINQKIDIESDIIINLNEKSNKSFYFYKRNAIVIDLSNSHELEKNIIKKRNDIITIDNFSIKADGKLISNEMLESILYIKHYQRMRKFYTYKYAVNFKDILNRYNITIDKFYCFNRMVKRQVFNTKYSKQY